MLGNMLSLASPDFASRFDASWILLHSIRYVRNMYFVIKVWRYIFTEIIIFVKVMIVLGWAALDGECIMCLIPGYYNFDKCDAFVVLVPQAKFKALKSCIGSL